MQDIVYRKASSPQSAAPQAAQPVPKKATPTKPIRLSQASLVVEKSIQVASAAGSWIMRVAGTKPLAVINQPRVILPAVRPAQAPKPDRRKQLVSGAKRATGKARVVAHSARHAAKTPLGKVTIVQAAALLALFAYVAHGTPSKTAAPSTNGSKPASNQTLYQFLPTAQDYVQPQPFQEVAAQKSAGIPLHVWATPWNLDSLAANESSYATVSAFWLTLQPDGTSVQPKADWSQWKAFSDKYKQSNQKFYLTVTGDPAVVLAGIINPDARKTQIANLLQTVQQQGFDGIDIDYEGLGQTNRETFTSFIADLTQAFHDQKKQVAVTVEAALANQVPQDWHAISLLADQVRIMAYDYHASSTGSPGPVAPLGWIKEIMDYASVAIDPSKLVVGLGDYGYDWQKPDASDQSWKGSGVSFEQAVALAKLHNAPITRASGIDERGYDIGSIPNFTYQDDQSRIHSVWFEDSASVQAKVSLINQYQNQGVIFWSVSMGDSKFWLQTPAAPNVTSN